MSPMPMAHPTTVPTAKPTSVLIVIVSYRTAALVTKTLASIAEERKRTPHLDVRTVVVDNASGDAPHLERAVAENDWGGWATILTSDRNGGFSYGNNVGFRHAYKIGFLPEFFYLLNPDTEVRAGAVEALVHFLQTRPEAGIAGGSLEDQSGTVWPYA